MNYGYDKDTPGWKEDRKQLLAEMLAKKLPAHLGRMVGGVTPYIEVDGLYEGVRIRKITNIATEDRDSFIARADKIYHEVMED